jgi:ABC-type nitrate/sulfonate/bicarbonate transport system substrate-binding protein
MQAISRRVSITATLLLAVAAGAAGQAPRQTLKVNLGDVSLHKAPFIIAAEQHLFEKYGLDVDLRISKGAAAAVAESGFKVNQAKVGEHADPDLSASGGAPTMVAMVAGTRRQDQVIIATTDSVLRAMVFVKPHITTPEQLKGKRLGASGHSSVTGFAARVFAERQGWDPDKDVTIVPDTLGLKFLTDGTIDALVALEMHSAATVFAGFKPLVVTAGWNVPVAGSSVVTTRAWLEAPGNRDKARRFLMALVEGISLLKKDEKYMQQAFREWYGITNREQVGWIWKNGKDLMQAKPYPAVDGIKKVMEVYDSPEMRRRTPESFYDSGLMKELDESGFIDQFYK